ncbi:MAG TPA: V-type ATP synthase subunit D [Geopsychrobacteraceae bacterium]|nr:V-type ATP synthase subunit D [Geopsychrobacteraceae bacterium]
MIQPTRTNLMMLKDRTRAVISCTGILKGRRRALIKEFLEIGRPLISSREAIRQRFEQAISELEISAALEGEDYISSLSLISQRHIGVKLIDKNLLGLQYQDVRIDESASRSLNQRDYDYPATTQHLEEAIQVFEEIIEEMLEMARYEALFKRLGEELLKITRRIRVLEERVLPGLKEEIKVIVQYLAERERENYYRLKLFKGCLARRG